MIAGIVVGLVIFVVWAALRIAYFLAMTFLGLLGIMALFALLA